MVRMGAGWGRVGQDGSGRQIVGGDACVRLCLLMLVWEGSGSRAGGGGGGDNDSGSRNGGGGGEHWKILVGGWQLVTDE